jgi:aminoglycoside/choline kinase family phosphotransferase
MVTAADNPGILDFQDAVEGPLTYDLVSLVKDCYVRWDPAAVEAWTDYWLSQLEPALRTQIDASQLLRWADLMGVQRHLKAAGIFSRLNHRDGKPAYMADVPRALGYVVDLRSRYPELAFVIDLIERRCLPALEAAP